MRVLSEIGKWLLRLAFLWAFLFLIAVISAYYLSQKNGEKHQTASRKAKATLTTMWNEVDAQWPMNTPIPKGDLDDWIISKTGSEAAADFTTIQAKHDSDPLIIYHGPEIHPYVHILFRDGGMTTWDHTWRSVYLKPNDSELGNKTQQTEP